LAYGIKTMEVNLVHQLFGYPFIFCVQPIHTGVVGLV